MKFNSLGIMTYKCLRPQQFHCLEVFTRNILKFHFHKFRTKIANEISFIFHYQKKIRSCLHVDATTTTIPTISTVSSELFLQLPHSPTPPPWTIKMPLPTPQTFLSKCHIGNRSHTRVNLHSQLGSSFKFKCKFKTLYNNFSL